MKRSNHEGYIKVRGGRIWYSISGRDKPGAPIVVLHGGPATSHYYLRSLKKLSAERPVILYDQLGCGKSDRPKDKSLWTIERYAEELDDIRKALGLERMHILGQSWGTMLAVDYMLTRNPSGIISLILSSPSLSASLWQEDCKRLISQMRSGHRNTIMDSESSGNFGSLRYMLATVAFYRKHICRMNPWPACFIKTFLNTGQDVYVHMWGRNEFTVTGTLKDYERAQRLKDIKTPALFTCGRYDESTPETTEYYHKMMPGSELIVFEDSAHMHHIEKKGPYLNAVRSFVNRVEGLN